MKKNKKSKFLNLQNYKRLTLFFAFISFPFFITASPVNTSPTQRPAGITTLTEEEEKAIYQEFIDELEAEYDERERKASEGTASNALEEDNYDSDNVESLVLVNNSAFDLIRLLEKLTGRTAIIPGDLPAISADFHAGKPLTRTEAICAVESLLSVNNIGISNMGEKFLIAAPKARIRSQGIPILEQVQTQIPSQSFYTKVFPLKFLATSEINSILFPILTPFSSSMVVLEKTNSIMITDTLANLQKVDQVLKTIDIPAINNIRLKQFPLKYVTANEVLKKLQSLQQNSRFKSLWKDSTSFEVDERTNHILVVGPEEAIAQAGIIIAQLDVDVAPIVQSEVIHLKHAEAKPVSELINNIIKTQRENAREDEKDAPKGKAKDAASPNTHEPFAQFSKKLTLESDERSNAIVIYGSLMDIRQVKTLIDQLDTVLPQVRIEVIIAEVSLNNGEVSGLQTLGLQYKLSNVNGLGTEGTLVSGVKKNLKIGASAVKKGDISPLKMVAAIDSHRPFYSSLFTEFQDISSNTRTKLLSAPIIVTTHNKEAIIESGQKEPIVESTVSNIGDSSGRSTNSAVKYQNIGLTLKVKPLIGNNGIVQLQIEQKYETKSGETKINDIMQPVLASRQANSFISVKSGQVVALAGLQYRQNIKTKAKTFFWGYIPILGDALFNPKKETEEVKDLIILIRPQVLLNPEDADEYTQKILDNNIAKSNIQSFLGDNNINEDALTNYLIAEKEEKEGKRRYANQIQNKNINKRRGRHKIDRKPKGRRKALPANKNTLPSEFYIVDNPYEDSTTKPSSTLPQKGRKLISSLNP